MKRLPTGLQITLAILLLLDGAAQAGGALPALAAPTTTPTGTGGGNLEDFQLVEADGGSAAGAGWAVVGQQLFWTADGGRHWRDITPLGQRDAEIRAASFSNSQNGWVVATTPRASGTVDYSLARTTNGGQTWQAAPLALFAADDAAGMA